ncbi:MAG: chemotaxis protein [Oscillospiraceae bacterium]
MKNQKTGILLETGTNEIEIMEFTINNETFGINVAKVREIMIPEAIKPMPKSHPAVEGVFKPREDLITVINLPKYLDLENDDAERSLFIITNFNNMHIAFRVHSVEGIHRISWTNIQKPDKTIYNGADGIATGIAECMGRLITILDFEKIVADISPETSIQISDIDKMGGRVQNDHLIMIAEDSKLLTMLIKQCLNKAGYVNIIAHDNGQELWDHLNEMKKTGESKSISCIITDIEMPQMDGHRLTKLIKTDPQLQQIPIVIFSSLISEEMRIKGKQLGADEQISKPEIAKLVTILDRFVK